MTNGYLGFGVDVFGNYRNNTFGGSNCPDSISNNSSQNVTVRGPGNGASGYCIQGSSLLSSGALDARTNTTRPAAMPVEIALNPASSAATTPTGLTVPAGSWLIVWTPLGGSQQSLSRALPTSATLAAYNFPAAYYNPATGLPYQLTFGWAASTGSNTEIHEVSTLASTTLNGQLPVFALGVTDNQNGRFLAGNSATVSITPSLDASQGSESQPATVTTTFPAGLTPSNPSTTDYVCTTTGQVVSCKYTPAGSITPGASLPTLNIPVAVASNAAASLTITAKVSSTDANPQATSRTVAVTPFTATVSAPTVAYGSPDTLTGVGLPSNATGTVTFKSGATTVCTATLPTVSCGSALTLPPGSYPVTATYSGDGAYAPSTATTTFTVTKATTALTAGVASPTVGYGTSDTVSFSGLAAGASGSVTFTSGATAICTVPDITVASSCATPAAFNGGHLPRHRHLLR